MSSQLPDLHQQHAHMRTPMQVRDAATHEAPSSRKYAHTCAQVHARLHIVSLKYPDRTRSYSHRPRAHWLVGEAPQSPTAFVMSVDAVAISVTTCGDGKSESDYHAVLILKVTTCAKVLSQDDDMVMAIVQLVYMFICKWLVFFFR